MGNSQVTMVVSILQRSEAIAWRHALALLSSTGVPDAVMQGSRDVFGMVSNPFIYTLWLFNIAVVNGPFIDVFPIKTSIYKGFSIAMLNNQMVEWKLDFNGFYIWILWSFYGFYIDFEGNDHGETKWDAASFIFSAPLNSQPSKNGLYICSRWSYHHW